MSGNIYISSPAPTPTILNQDINLNSVLQGQVSYASPINVFLEDSLGNPITPTGSVLVGNDLTATLATPNPSGVALQFPTPDQYISYATGDIGWRYQNGFFDYTYPAYPAKFAELDYTAGANSWYKLKTPLSVGGVSSTQRFVDINGVQGWGLVGNANVAVIDKLTGLMFTRGFTTWGTAQWINQINNALSYSVIINGNTYADWYMISLREFDSIFGQLVTLSNWVDPISGLTITSTLSNSQPVWLANGLTSGTTPFKQFFRFEASTPQFDNSFQGDNYQTIRIHKAYNLISA
jgi:hypothetical protein